MLIHNALVVTMDETNRIIPSGAVRFADGNITDVGTDRDLISRFPEEKKIDAEGRVLLPGLINSHMHLYSTFARGISLKDPPPEEFRQILERLWWRLDKALDEEAIRLSAEYILIQAIRNGTTTLIDHHSSPSAVTGSLDILAEAFIHAGLRGVLCYEVSDRDGEKVKNQAIEENRRCISHLKKNPSPLLAAQFGLHASFTLSENTLRECAETGNELDAGFHVHCCEAFTDLDHCRKNFGKTVVERFHAAGILKPETIAAHCVHVTESDLEILAETGAFVAHNPRSNMNNAVGAADIHAMCFRNVNVGLGTDGMSVNMGEELKTADLVQKHRAGDPQKGGNEIVELLTKGNPDIAGKLFHRRIGSIEQNAAADMILVDYDPPTPLEPDNLSGHLLFGLAGAPVNTTIVNGKILMRDGEIQTLDEEKINDAARKTAKRVWKKF